MNSKNKKTKPAHRKQPYLHRCIGAAGDARPVVVPDRQHGGRAADTGLEHAHRREGLADGLVCNLEPLEDAPGVVLYQSRTDCVPSRSVTLGAPHRINQALPGGKAERGLDLGLLVEGGRVDWRVELLWVELLLQVAQPCRAEQRQHKRDDQELVGVPVHQLSEAPEERLDLPVDSDAEPP